LEPKSTVRSAILQWALFLILLAAAAGAATWSVLDRAGHMRLANTPSEAFLTTRPGKTANAVVCLNRVRNRELSGTLLQRVSETVYHRPPIQSALTVEAVLTPQTTVVMGRPEEIVDGAVVQIAGTLDSNHVLHASQIVILTGFVRVEGERVGGDE
jgi:hypothetical protein